MSTLPDAGAACSELCQQAIAWWLQAAQHASLDINGLDPNAPLEHRLTWARQRGLEIGTIYCRYSSKNQHSTADQVRPTITYAAQKRIYVPPELLNVDEAAKGRRTRRDRLVRLQTILKSRRATILLVYKVSRLFRQAFMGYQLIQQEVVEEGLRAISISQGIDTADERSWKAQLQLHGLLDDLLLDAIADHCREGLVGLFLGGYVTGALTVGYKPVEVPGAPPTNRGKPRTMPAIDTSVSELIRGHFELIRNGMPLTEGLRRWRAAGGPVDPRSTTRVMTYHAYRRLLSNVRYTGRWEFGRKRNRWSSKRDYTRQVDQPDEAVKVRQCEELRIVSDELFIAVQRRLRDQETGPRAPRPPKVPLLCDLVTRVFQCPRCRRRFHTCGVHCRAMRCSGPTCPTPAMVRRDEAVAAVCQKLTELLNGDSDLISRTIIAAQQLAARTPDDIGRQVVELERTMRTLSNRITDLTELAGEGTETDRAQLKSRVRATQAERAEAQLRLARLKQTEADGPSVTEADIRTVLNDVGALLQEAAAGRSDPTAAYKAADLFCRLVGQRIWVDVEERKGRKRPVVRGRFTPQLLQSVTDVSNVTSDVPTTPPTEVVVWLRSPPRLDAIADEVRRLYEEEGLGFRAIAKRLDIGCGYIYTSYLRSYQKRGLPVPPRRPRGRPPAAG
jgi:DNA invertase Pin-like site-specific DNA recombinase